MIGSPIQLIEFLYNQEKDKIFEVKEKRKNRSMNQNSYSWVLQNQLASKLRLPLEELHMRLLKSYGEFEVVSLLANVDPSTYFEYYDEIGRSELHDKEFKHLRIYKPTHKMNSTEMARFIDGLVEECKHQGIPTLTKKQIEELGV